MAQEERRRFPRLKVQTALRYQQRGSSDSDNAVCDDISAGGVSFTNDRFIQPSSVLMLEITLLSQVLNAVGRVVWSSSQPHSDRYRQGVEFLEIGQKEKNFLVDFIDMQLGGL